MADTTLKFICSKCNSRVDKATPMEVRGKSYFLCEDCEAKMAELIEEFIKKGA